MGYPFGSTEFRPPNLLLPGLIRHLISSLFHPLGLSHYLLDPPTPSPAQPDSIPDPNPHSLSPSRFQDLLHPVMKFSDLEEDHPPPPEDCAVCLCAFDSGDEVRRLTNCRHVFHRSCHDPWMDEELFVPPGAPSLLSSFSTTHCGRPKTCPLCRAPIVPG